MQDPQSQTVEFYQIRLMEKQREVSDFEAKLKKIQFKNNRDLKQMKMAEQRAKQLLKQQKTKLDKISKQSTQNEQQNKLLLLRMNEIKEEKDKQIQDIRGQYNMLKEEVRSYQRILPNHIFLTQLAITIEQIPTYEEIFIKLKEKSEQLLQSETKYEAFKIKMQERIEHFQSNEELLKQKKLEAEKNLKEVLPKIIELENQISDMNLTDQQKQQQIEELKFNLLKQTQKTQNLEILIKQCEQKSQQMNQNSISEIHAKEEEMRIMTQQQFDKYEEEIKNLLNKIDVKQNGYVNQVNLLLEDNQFLQNQIQKEKERFEENYNEFKENIEQITEQVGKERFKFKELEEKYNQTLTNLITLSQNNEQTDRQLKQTRDKFENLTKQVEIRKKREAKQEEKQSIFESIKEQNQYLEERCKQLQQKLQMKEQNSKQLAEQNQVLIGEIELFKKQSGPHSQIPNIFENYDAIRRKRTSSEFSIEKHEIQMPDRESLEQIQQTNPEKEQNAKYNQIIQELKQSNIKYSKQLEQKRQNLQKQILENRNLKEKNNQMLNNLNEVVSNASALTLKANLAKSQNESNQKQLDILTSEKEKQKNQIIKLKEQLKSIKDDHKRQFQNLEKQKKEELLIKDDFKCKLQKLENQLKQKEKNFHYQIITIKNEHQKIQKINEQAQKQILNLQKQVDEKSQLQKTIKEYQKKILKLEEQQAKTEEKLMKKQRQIKNVEDSLDRQITERTLRNVKSLKKIESEDVSQQTFNRYYFQVTQKQGQIHNMQRQITQLKQQMQELKINHSNQIESLQIEQNQYIKNIIDMKLRCAQSEMKASEKEHRFSQLKKKFDRMSYQG